MTSAQYIKKTGGMIRWIRIHHRNLSLPKLAQLAGVSKGTLSKIENHGGDVNLGTLHKIATALNLRVNDLLP